MPMRVPLNEDSQLPGEEAFLFHPIRLRWRFGSTMLLPRQAAHVPADSRGVSPQHARCSPPTRHVPGIGSSAEGGESELALSLECRQVRVRDGLVWKRFTRRR